MTEEQFREAQLAATELARWTNAEYFMERLGDDPSLHVCSHLGDGGYMCPLPKIMVGELRNHIRKARADAQAAFDALEIKNW